MQKLIPIDKIWLVSDAVISTSGLILSLQPVATLLCLSQWDRRHPFVLRTKYLRGSTPFESICIIIFAGPRVTRAPLTHSSSMHHQLIIITANTLHYIKGRKMISRMTGFSKGHFGWVRADDVYVCTKQISLELVHLSTASKYWAVQANGPRS